MSTTGPGGRQRAAGGGGLRTNPGSPPVTVGGSAGPEKIAFPAGWERFVLYNTVDRYDNKQYRELYASSQEAVDAAKAGKPLPHGTVLALIQYKAQVDAQGQPTKDAKGRL